MHGGKSLSGTAHPNWNHGRRSKYRLPNRLQAAFEASVDDPELVSLRSELALMDAMINEVLRELDGVERTTWPSLVATSDAIDAAAASGDTKALRVAIDAQQALIKIGARHAAIVLDVANMLEKRSRIAAREHRRMVKLDAMVTYDEFLARLVLMMGAVREYVSDPYTISRIASAWDDHLGTLTNGRLVGRS